MNISAINAINTAKVQSSFKGNSEPKPLLKVTEDMDDNTIVGYGTWGPNYVYPIYAGQINKSTEQLAKQAAVDNARKAAEQGKEETPEEYYKRKLYSTEWCM